MSQISELERTERDDAPAPRHDRIKCAPRADIYETPNEVVVLCDMPGVKPHDVDVKFEKGELRLSGRITTMPLPGQTLTQEYDIGRFARTFSIAPEIDTEKISAECSEGVVTLHLPRKESAKPKQIHVHHANNQ